VPSHEWNSCHAQFFSSEQIVHASEYNVVLGQYVLYALHTFAQLQKIRTCLHIIYIKFILTHISHLQEGTSELLQMSTERVGILFSTTLNTTGNESVQESLERVNIGKLNHVMWLSKYLNLFSKQVEGNLLIFYNQLLWLVNPPHLNDDIACPSYINYCLKRFNLLCSNMNQ